MICPVCEAEYEPGVTTCPDDNAELVQKLHSPRDDSEARFVPLQNVGSPAEAEMVNDILHQNGIRSVIKAGGADAFSPLLSATADGAVILVDERDADRAQELYSAFFGEDEPPLTGGSIEDELEDDEEE
jgi:hypothetical protein